MKPLMAKMSSLTILHLNIQSVTSLEKKTQLYQLIHIHNPDFISLNETYLKPHDDFEIEGYRILRDDRLDRIGGGVALLIKNNIKGKQIEIDIPLTHDYVVGFLAHTSYGEIAIVSTYTPPNYNISLNQALYKEIAKHRKLVILGDLNAKSKLWYNKKTDKRGLQLEEYLTLYDLHVLNNSKPTRIPYPNGRRTVNPSVIDLSICSNSMSKTFKEFQVLSHQISDHLPTLTSFYSTPAHISFNIKKIDYKKYADHLTSNCPTTTITDCQSLDLAAAALETALNSSLSLATKCSTISKPHRNSPEVPKEILDLIRLKRKARRLKSKKNSPENRRIFNQLSSKTKAKLQLFHQSRLEAQFTALSSFNQSSAKHWKIVNNLDRNKTNQEQPTTLFLDKIPVISKQEIAQTFGTILSTTFGTETTLCL